MAYVQYLVMYVYMHMHCNLFFFSSQNDKICDALHCRYMKLQANPKSTHIRVIPAPDEVISKLHPDQTSHSGVYVVHGVTVGTTHLMFNATTMDGKVISSWPSEIQVFDALKLSPKYITLLPTAMFQVSYNFLSLYTV